MDTDSTISNYAHLFGIACTCLRLFTVYGPRQRPDLAISKFAHKILAGDTVQKYGDGSTSRDYTYIDEIISGIVAAIEYDKTSFEVFNLGGSATTTLQEMIQLVEQATGRTAKIEQLPDQPGDVPRTYANVGKAEELLGYRPETPIKEGIEKYVDWLKARLSLRNGSRPA
jgi:UDP-glucuronate 4-epimerase